MELQSIINIAVAGAFAALGWFGRMLWEMNNKLRSELSDLREDIPKNYVAKTDFRESWNQVMELLRRIDEKLDRKADK